MSYNPQTPRRVGGASSSSSSGLFGKPGSLLFGTPHSDHNSPSSNFESGWGAGSTWKLIQHPAPLALSSLGYFAFPLVSLATGSSSSSSSATTTTAFSFGLNASFGSFRTTGGLGNRGADSDSRTASTSASTAAPPPAPTLPAPPPADPTTSSNTTKTSTNTTTTTSTSTTTPDPDAYQTHLAHLHTLRLTREASEARKGEEYWVSCGGVLRDEHGRRDLARTREIREELRLREVERVLLERWEVYEGRWKELGERVRRLSSRTNSSNTSSSSNSNSNNGHSNSGLDNEDDDDDNASLSGEQREFLTFSDIPWPIDLSSPSSPPPTTSSPLTTSNTPSPTPPTPTLLASLTPALIEPFLLLPLTVRSNPTSKKERIRSSLLRWHPDKLAAVLALTEEEGGEREAVLQGVHAVFRVFAEVEFWGGVEVRGWGALGLGDITHKKGKGGRVLGVFLNTLVFGLT